MLDAPALDERATATRTAEPAQVIPLDLDPCRGELSADVLVPTAVLGDAMDEQDRRPRIGVDSPATDENGSAVSSGHG